MDRDREELIETFLAETEERLAEMEESLVALEQHPADDEGLDSVFRCAHTLKGNASVLELGPPTTVGHAVEAVLDRVRAGAVAVTPGLVTLLLRGVDALRELIPAALAGAQDLPPAHVALTDLLQAVAEGRSLESDSDGAAVPAPTTPRFGRRQEDWSMVGAARTPTLRLEVSKLDRMLDVAGEVAVARGRLLQKLEALGPAGVAAREAARETERLCFDLQDLLLRARMVSIEPTFRRYVRMVRDVAAFQGKRVRLEIEAGDVEVDAAVIERLVDPLTHMIRNALDHGLETPAARADRGKDPCGTVSLVARHEAGSVVIEVSDDGEGLDREGILRRARRSGLIPENGPAPVDVERLIFEPGFSTSEAVTALSGRGVGLDVVARNIEELRGTVQVESVAGRGTLFRVRLPLTLAIIDGLAVEVGRETYVIPLTSIAECVELPEAEGHRSRRSGVFSLRDELLPYVRLSALFGFSGEGTRRQHVVVVHSERGRAGLVVDALKGERQTVVKPLSGLFRRIPGASGTAVLADGGVALILDVPSLIAQAHEEPETACA